MMKINTLCQVLNNLMKAYFLNLEIFAVKKMSAMSFTFLLHRIKILTNAKREEKLSHGVERESKLLNIQQSLRANH